MLPREAVRLEPGRWRISLNRLPLGWSSQEVERLPDGQGKISSILRFERLPLDQLLENGVGSLGGLLSRGLSRAEFSALGPISLTIRSQMHFNHFAQLESFESLVLEDSWGECIRISGVVRENRLTIQAYLLLGADNDGRGAEPVLQRQLDLPSDKLVVDSLAPRPRYRNLRLGQRWTFETYHPLFPTRPLQTVEAHVADRRVLRIDGRDVRTFHVVCERADDDGLSLERHVGDLFVTADGTVVRQTLTWAGGELTFDMAEGPPLD
jgi:hypothetical protein